MRKNITKVMKSDTPSETIWWLYVR